LKADQVFSMTTRGKPHDCLPVIDTVRGWKALQPWLWRFVVGGFDL
jgi:hypothetical protein